MKDKIKSLNDLSIALHEINKKYKIEDFVEAYKKAINHSSDTILEELKFDPSTNPFQKIVNISNKITDEMMEKLIKSTSTLSSKYSYNEYLDECNSLRDCFLKDRKTYFSSKVIVSNKKKDAISNIFELSGTADLVLGDFLDKVINRIYPASLEITYEDLGGKKIKTRVRHKPLIITADHIEAPLIDRHHGINAYDSFLLRSYFDIKKNEWIYIPIRLVVKVNCDEELSDVLENME